MVENKLTKNKYFYSTAVIVITILGVLGLFFAVITPFYSKAGSLTSEAKTKQTELKMLEDKKTKLEALKSKEEELNKDAETVRNALPEQKDVGRLFIEFDNMARSSGGVIKSVSENIATTTTTTEAVGSSAGLVKIGYKVPIDFKDYFGFKDFVTKAEKALRIIGIDDYSITVNETNGGLTVDLSTSTYVRN